MFVLCTFEEYSHLSWWGGWWFKGNQKAKPSVVVLVPDFDTLPSFSWPIIHRGKILRKSPKGPPREYPPFN